MRYTPVLVHLQRLEIEAGLVHSEISLRLARDGGVIIAQFYMGLFQSLLFLASKDYQQALNSADQILTVTRQHIPFLEPAVLEIMAIIQIEQGEINGAGALIDQFQVNPEQRAMLMMLLPELATCRYMLAQAAYSDLILITQKVTEFVQKQGITLLAPQFYKIQGQAQIALSDHEAARESVQSGLSLIQQTEARWGRSELASLMDDLQRSQN